MTLFFKINLLSKLDGLPSLSKTSQLIFATAGASGRQGSIWNVVGSGNAINSVSLDLSAPKIDDPSKLIPSFKTFSNSKSVIPKPLMLPNKSVNHNLINFTSFSLA